MFAWMMRERLYEIIKILVFDDSGMREEKMSDIVKRVSDTFKDEQYLRRVSSSRQRWLDNDIHEITDGIIKFIAAMTSYDQ